LGGSQFEAGPEGVGRVSETLPSQFVGSINRRILVKVGLGHKWETLFKQYLKVNYGWEAGSSGRTPA
jgi:hypothetical protein